MSAKAGMRKAWKQARSATRRAWKKTQKSKPAGGGSRYAKKRGKVRKPDGWRPADVGAVLKRLNEGEE